MNISNFSFTFGKVDIAVSGLDGEKATGQLVVTAPLEKWTIKLVLHSGKNWSDLRSWRAEVSLNQNPEPKPDEDEDEDSIPFEEDGDEDNA